MNPLFLPATQQLALLRSGQISPMELAELHIAQVNRLNPILNALVHFDPEQVRREAKSLPPGPLHGLVMTIKSSIATRGNVCAIGSTLKREQRPDEDARSVAILRQNGALILGNTNCPEFLMAYETDNLLYGRTNNPWALDRTAGGSSGGESAAIASGMSGAGLGSDSGGSVREPAHFTGICSFKPTSGRISAEGHLPPCVGPFSRLGAIGPMARSVADLQLLSQVLIDGSIAPETSTPPVRYRSVSPEQARQITVGYFEEDALIPVTSETRLAVTQAVEALRGAGFRVVPFRPGLLEELRQLWITFFVQCGALFYQPTISGREAGLSPVFLDFLSMAAQEGPLTGNDLLTAWASMDEITTRFLNLISPFPVLLLPVCAIPAFRHGERAWEIEGKQVGYLEAMRFMQWFNVLGAPAAVVPVLRNHQGLPVGVQIAGRPFGDELVLEIAAALDASFGYAAPPLQ